MHGATRPTHRSPAMDDIAQFLHAHPHLLLSLSLLVAFAISLAATLTISILIIYGGMHSIMTATIEILQQVAFFLIASNILCLFQWVVRLCTHEYDCIMASLHNCLVEDAEAHTRLTKPPYEYPELISPRASTSRNQVMCSSGVWTLSTGNQDPVNLFEVDHRLREAKERIVRVNKLLILARRYCGVPVTLMMLYSVAACILSLFYMSFLLQLEEVIIALTCLFIVNSLVAPLSLCNVPHSLDEKVGDALSLLRRLWNILSTLFIDIGFFNHLGVDASTLSQLYLCLALVVIFFFLVHFVFLLHISHPSCSICCILFIHLVFAVICFLIHLALNVIYFYPSCSCWCIVLSFFLLSFCIIFPLVSSSYSPIFLILLLLLLLLLIIFHPFFRFVPFQSSHSLSQQRSSHHVSALDLL